MRVIKGDLWEEIAENQYSAVLIPTNGLWNRWGEAVMGAGVAFQAKTLYPGIEKILGNFLQHNARKMNDPQLNEPWNVPYKIGVTEKNTIIFSFPTKPTWVYTNSYNDHIIGKYKKEIGNKKKLPGWQAKSDLSIINRSARLISKVCAKLNSVALPAVGCGHGELYPNDVIPVLKKYFDDRYVVIVKL